MLLFQLPDIIISRLGKRFISTCILTLGISFLWAQSADKKNMVVFGEIYCKRDTSWGITMPGQPGGEYDWTYADRSFLLFDKQGKVHFFTYHLHHDSVTRAVAARLDTVLHVRSFKFTDKNDTITFVLPSKQKMKNSDGSLCLKMSYTCVRNAAKTELVVREDFICGTYLNTHTYRFYLLKK